MKFFGLGLPSPRNRGRPCRVVVCLGRRSISSTNQTIATRIVNTLVFSITRNSNGSSSTNSTLRTIPSSHVDITWHTGVIVQGDFLIIGVRRGCHFGSGLADARPPMVGERTGFSIGRKLNTAFSGCYGSTCQLLGTYPCCILYINHHHSAVLHPGKLRRTR